MYRYRQDWVRSPSLDLLAANLVVLGVTRTSLRDAARERTVQVVRQSSVTILDIAV
ncbi:MAG: hypothetical protein RMY33_013830 [Nostoc sp. DedQUE03]|nr:hypothetical protein [Nostoc sp. DedQUE03]MDZ7975828.1 hypothetical protein [Nostoc sp. DedQUE03]MDZ8048362.1 hypothetical protein [Nostoc sp. DedQUE02]